MNVRSVCFLLAARGACLSDLFARLAEREKKPIAVIQFIVVIQFRETSGL
jgi:hypothetical protein